MKKLMILLTFFSLLTGCNVTETIVFNEDGSGEFIVGYDMGEMMKQMKAFDANDNTDKAADKKVMDTTMVFADMMETYKDSIALLSKEEQQIFENLKNMSLEMHMDEDKGIMNMGIGMKFESVEDLRGIQEKIKKAQSFTGQKDQVAAVKENSPLKPYMGEDNNVAYSYTSSEFTRVTTRPEMTEEQYNEFNALFNDDGADGNDIMDYFRDSYYTIKLKFPQKVKSVDIEGASISDDGKEVSYKTSWLDYIKNPKSVDIAVKFYE